MKTDRDTMEPDNSLTLIVVAMNRATIDMLTTTDDTISFFVLHAKDLNHVEYIFLGI